MTMYTATSVSYVKTAERLLGDDADFLNENPDLVPQFVNALFQSLEILLKDFGNKSGLTIPNETRSGRGGLIGNGHDIKKLGQLLQCRLGDDVTEGRLVSVLTHGISVTGANDIIKKMIFGDVFAPTRDSYKNRKLVYIAELEYGDIQIVQGLKPWLTAVKAAAENVGNSIELVKRWKTTGACQSFKYWHIREISYIYR